VYLKHFGTKYYGPLVACDFELSFSDNGEPIPTVLVGANGSGKSLLLSIVLDAYVTMRNTVFSDTPEVKAGKLFKPIKHTIRSHGDHSHHIAKCSFLDGERTIDFVEVATAPNDAGEYQVPDSLTPDMVDTDRFSRNGLSKKLSIELPKVPIGGVTKDVFAYYPAGRAETPGWLSENVTVTFQNSQKFSDEAAYSVWRTDLVGKTSSWITDLVLDCELYDRKDLQISVDGAPATPGYVVVKGKNRKLLDHLNDILSRIITTGNPKFASVRLGISERSRGGRQVQVLGRRLIDQQEEILAHTLQDLSTGELAVFCIFADLVQISELQGWNREQLSEIKGIALIDEADLHLHVRLQKDVLPQLIQLMPKLQFIITTHSPLLTLGSAEQGAKIIGLPNGLEIDASEFDEFDAAYKVFINKNSRFRDELLAIKQKVANLSKPLVITEGKTDWKHLQLALSRLVTSGEIDALDVEFFETPANMGSGELQKVFDVYAKIRATHPVICIFDRDEEKYVKEFEKPESEFIMRNGVVAMCLKVPNHRSETPDICIEHLYTDDALRTCIPNTEKRLRFMNEIGVSADRKSTYIRPTPGEPTLKIFDQDVSSISHEDGSEKGELAISKSVFLEEIASSGVGTDFDFSGFLPSLERLASAIASIESESS
jgi:predicted ATPase